MRSVLNLRRELNSYQNRQQYIAFDDFFVYDFCIISGATYWGGAYVFERVEGLGWA